MKICDIPNTIDLDIVKKLVTKDIEANSEYFNDIKCSYRINDPKKAEWIIHKSIKNSKLVGDGNNFVDVEHDNNGFDICVLTLSNKYTNEKSIIQNFGNEKLDNLFCEDKCDEIINYFITNLKNKFSKNNKINNVYYLVFICKQKEIYLMCINLMIDKLDLIKSGGTNKNKKNIKILNMINSNIGKINIYKSKKRMEIRFINSVINNEKVIKIYDNNLI